MARISEKTLELNVTRELLDEADALAPMLAGVALGSRAIPASRARLLARRLRPAYAVGVPIDQETSHDVEVHMTDLGGRPCVFFYQFKRPRFQRYSRKGAFKGSSASPRPHYLFGVNDNGAKDQHVAMTRLARTLPNPKAVLYALPRIATHADLLKRLGVLLSVTSMVAADEVDAEAARQGKPILAGQSHHLAVSPGGAQWELRSEPAPLEEVPDRAVDLAADIVAVRASRVLLALQEVMREGPAAAGRDAPWQDAFDAYLVGLAAYFGLEPSRARQVLGVSLDEGTERGLHEARRQRDAWLAPQARWWAGEEGARESPREPDEVLWADRERAAHLSSAVSAALSPYRSLMARGDWSRRQLPAPELRVSAFAPSFEGLSAWLEEARLKRLTLRATFF
ncbi:MAG: hypothetical protein QOE90_3552 [Thermoplasmata archaeon]|nr:hypothetical protein [Thermoplasmata archaeon]